MEYYIINEDCQTGMDDFDSIVGFNMPSGMDHDMVIDRNFEAIGTDPIRIVLNKNSGSIFTDPMIRDTGIYISDETKQRFDALGVDIVFAKPVTLVHRKLPERNYWLVFFPKHDCIDKEKTLALPFYNGKAIELNPKKIHQIGPFVIDTTKIGTPDGNNERPVIVELTSYRTIVVVNEPMKKELEKMNLPGLEIFNTKDYDTWQYKV